MSEVIKKSRIYRYKYGINKFISQKSPLINISEHNKDTLDTTYQHVDHLIGICLISILHGRTKKKKLKFNGYFMACGVDIALMIANVTDRYYCYKKDISYEDWCNFCPEMVSKLYHSLARNVDALKLDLPKDEIFDINQKCINYLVNGIGGLTKLPKHSSNKRIKKTDFNDYRFKKPEDKKKYRKLKFIDDETLYAHIDEKYGFVSKMSLLFGWLFGGGDEKKIPEIEELGRHMGIVFKIAYDFDHVEEDLEKCGDHTFNMVINKGIKESFEIFDTSKNKLIKGILTVGIWSNTIKEILDLVENKLDEGITCASLDENYEYSEFSESVA